MNLISAGRKALKARLQTISIDAGYRTNGGHNVRGGWFNEVITSEGCSFPLIVVQKGKDQPPKPGPLGMRKHTGYNILAAVDAGLDEYDDAMDDLLLDILQCIMPTEGIPLEWTPTGITQITIGAPEQVPPGEGSPLATAIIPVHLHTFIESRFDY